jgi:hypothetical protein
MAADRKLWRRSAAWRSAADNYAMAYAIAQDDILSMHPEFAKRAYAIFRILHRWHVSSGADVFASRNQ